MYCPLSRVATDVRNHPCRRFQKIGTGIRGQYDYLESSGSGRNIRFSFGMRYKLSYTPYVYEEVSDVQYDYR